MMALLKIARINFNPRSPGGERQDYGRPEDNFAHFNPRSPGGERRQTRARAKCLR